MSPHDTWTITNIKHDAQSLAHFNSVFTCANGYLAVKGNLSGTRDGPCPVTLINGVYDELDMLSGIGESAQPRPWLDPQHFADAPNRPAIANLPNPLSLRIFVAGRELLISQNTVRSFEQTLNLKSGVYRCRTTHESGLTIETTRFASLAHPHRIFMRVVVTPNVEVGPIRVLSGISTAVRSNEVAERQSKIERMNVDDTRGVCLLDVRTGARRIDVRMGVAHIVQSTQRYKSRAIVESDAVCMEYEFAGDGPFTIERFAAATCSEDGRHGVEAALSGELDAATHQGFDAALEEHAAEWRALWERTDVQIDGDDDAQRAIRFCIYHLLASAPRFTDKLSVPVKLLTGEYYQGNTFWDTDLYILPFYVFAAPEIARSCLNFRVEGLEPGREIARKLGCQGAKLAWQAGPYGEECLGNWYRFTRTNIHINADAVYALVQYVRASGDETFLIERGIDVLVESARFYVSRAAYDESRDAYDIHHVAGPDEAHCDSTNNFYTNYLVKRTLIWAAEQVERLRQGDAVGGIEQRLKLEPDEPTRWRHVADRLTLLFDPKTRLYEQCEGFFELPPPPADVLADRKDWFVPLHAYKAMNQPDVVMAMMLFRDDFDADVLRANWEFYKKRSMNFSSMSYPVNAIMAAEMGEMDEAYRNFMIAAGMDLDPSLTDRNDTHAGLHGTAMGGAWMAAVFGFGGVRLTESGLRIEPKLPEKWQALRFALTLRGALLNVCIDRDHVTLSVKDGRAIDLPITVAGQSVTLTADQPRRVGYSA
jgi:kojibiose phosphorylase